MRILVAEDDAVSRRVLEAVLERMGHDCDVTEDGDRAWAQLSQGVPVVLITDWMMPGLAGPDLCRKVREVYGESGYVIMLTESTRNGMSSETMSIAVCGDCQPLASNVGLYARTSDVPASRSRPNVQCESAAP